MNSPTYRDPTGVRHEVVVRQTATGDWEVLDTCAGEPRVIETLDGRVDGEPQAEAVACDYVTVGRFMPLSGRNGGDAIPEQGGADAHSDRSSSAERSPHARGTALSRQAR
ncbi:MAG TPA: hypothetical protein VED41_00370 [Solirubrobacteraceae bacterium]|nr:hypothetical protein [Solirubrobacteraceae bacterium]